MKEQQYVAEDTLQSRQAGEPTHWYARYLIYRNLKPNKRELLEAARIHQAQASKGPYRPYKHVPGAWKRQAEKWNWKARAEAHDSQLQTEQEERQRILREIEAAEIEKIMTSEYALKHKRVQGLNDMAALIKKSWVDEEGQINFKWLTPEKVKEYRGCLEDIAAELGERVKRKEISVTVLPKEYHGIEPDDDGSEP